MNIIELLSREHDRDGFDCGVEALNVYLRNTARQHIEKQISMTYVLVEKASAPLKPVLGYFTIGMCEVLASRLPPKLAKKYPTSIPAIRLGRLAIDTRHQGRKLGQALLIAALRQYVTAAESIGGVAMIVDAKDEQASAFYQHFGFTPFIDEPLKLFIPLGVVKQLFPA